MNRLFGLICVILCIVILLLSAACLPAGARSSLPTDSASRLRGDADGDGEISSIDVTIVQRVIAGAVIDSDGTVALYCDVTGDGLSLPDVTAIQRYLAGLKDNYRVGVPYYDDPYDPTEDNQLPILR